MAITRTVHLYDGPDGPFESMFVGDADAGTQPGILLFPNFMGTKEWDFAKAEMLASHGYKVLVVDYYGQGKRGTDMESAGKLLHHFMADRGAVKTRLLDALAELKSFPGVDGDKIGAIGFCAGGKCVLDLARAGAPIKAGVSFHGVYDAPPFPNAAMTAKLLICDGWNDNLCPPEAKQDLCRELAEGDVDFQFISYSRTGHAFTADDVPLNADRSFGFEPETNRRSWRSALQFLADELA
jgi:dienelactone hydrolase